MESKKKASGISKLLIAMAASIMWAACITGFAAWLDKSQNIGGRPLYFCLGALALGGTMVIDVLISKD